ncbi:MAG: Gfo/Idh/MocA family oxidoreductase [Ruminococcus sp.]|nr:Gfo/Idh/MocA family oxidoreductase [Candidatus Copronaster equi]
MDKIRIGVFGAWRGNAYIEIFQSEEKTELVAVCDKKFENGEVPDELENIECFSDFDTFLTEGKKLGMNSVFLANYFHQHAPYAIKAMEAGMNVVSECTSASTLKECVELVEAAERTGMKYMIAENYPFMLMNLKMNEIVKSGNLGTVLYAEGEYNHSGNKEELERLTPDKYHWRAWMPRTYYVTHALGPLMYMTDSMPKYVSARATHSELLYEMRDFRHNYDGVGMMFCEMSNGMIARFTGCTAMASDYSRYRIAGDVASVESGDNVGENNVRMHYFEHTKPENAEQISVIHVKPDDIGERAVKAQNAGHGGGDYIVVQNMIDYFLYETDTFFDVYCGAAMSATAILGWRSCLEHGKNYKIPDFHNKAERDAVRNDDLTPFPDENGTGITLPCALPIQGED